MRQKIDREKVKTLYLSGLGYLKISKIMGIARASAQKIIHDLGLSMPERAPKTKISTSNMIELYNCGLGIHRISNLNDISERSVWTRLKKAGVIDSTRQCKRKEGSRRSRRTARHEFKDSVKKSRFEEQQGICEICNDPIERNWRLALYHHKKLVSNGGDGSQNNCMVLHPKCHKEKFFDLHGIDFNKLDLYQKIFRHPRKEISLDKELIVKLYIKEGLSTQKIAEKMSLPVTRVRWEIKKLTSLGVIPKEVGIQKQRNGNTKITDLDSRLYTGERISVIAENLGLTERAVYYKIAKLKKSGHFSSVGRATD